MSRPPPQAGSVTAVTAIVSHIARFSALLTTVGEGRTLSETLTGVWQARDTENPCNGRWAMARSPRDEAARS